MAVETWIAFVVAASVLLVIPGPTILTVIGYSISGGRRANVPLVAAVALGDSTALFLSLVGLGALLATSAFAFTLVKTAGGLYLIYLGMKLFRSRGALPMPDDRASAEAPWRLFVNTYAVTALNPKGIVFFVAFLPQFIDRHANVAWQLWILAITFVVLATINATLYAWFASSARRLLATQAAQRRFRIVGGSLLVAAGAWALLARRSQA